MTVWLEVRWPSSRLCPAAGFQPGAFSISPGALVQRIQRRVDDKVDRMDDRFDYREGSRETSRL